MPQTSPWIEQPCLQYAQKGPVNIKEKNKNEGNNKVLNSSNGKVISR